MTPLQVCMQVGAIFRLITHKGNSNEPTKDTGEFNNIVLNTGLDRMSVGTYISQCNIGTGNSTPVATQTSLDAFLASNVNAELGSTTGGIQTTTEPYYGWVRLTYRFDPGVGTGNISEVGLGWSNTNLWNRALIKDLAGNPVTITKLADEFLDVIVELRVYLPTTISGSFNLKDKFGSTISTHTVTGKPLMLATGVSAISAGRVNLGTSQGNLRIYSGAVGATITNNPSGSTFDTTSGTAVRTFPTTQSVRVTYVVNLDVGNGFAHRSFATWLTNFLLPSGIIGFQWEITPTISKNNNQELRYPIVVSWSNYTP